MRRGRFSVLALKDDRVVRGETTSEQRGHRGITYWQVHESDHSKFRKTIRLKGRSTKSTLRPECLHCETRLEGRNRRGLAFTTPLIKPAWAPQNNTDQSIWDNFNTVYSQTRMSPLWNKTRRQKSTWDNIQKCTNEISLRPEQRTERGITFTSAPIKSDWPQNRGLIEG